MLLMNDFVSRYPHLKTGMVVAVLVVALAVEVGGRGCKHDEVQGTVVVTGALGHHHSTVQTAIKIVHKKAANANSPAIAVVGKLVVLNGWRVTILALLKTSDFTHLVFFGGHCMLLKLGRKYVVKIQVLTQGITTNTKDIEPFTPLWQAMG